MRQRFLGSVLKIAQQILGGGIPTPTQAQTAWANHLIANATDKEDEAGRALQWGLANNSTFQAAGEALEDGDMDYITAEYAKTYA